MNQEKKMPKGKPKLDFKIAGRIFAYMKPDRGKLILVVICILLSSVVSAVSSLFLGSLIDNYIMPLLTVESPVFSGLLRALLMMALLYLTGIAASLLYNEIIVTLAQKTLKQIRDEMFAKMQALPVRYFDSHTYGEVMSLYTNDTDTLRQMLAQATPQLIASLFTLITVFFSMLYISVPLTIVAVVLIFLVMRVTGKIVGRIGVHFAAQQRTLAEVNGYVEEMIGGQKVIKVFCHEEQARQELRQKNQTWADSSTQANANANMLMPLMNAVGYFQYVIIAVLGSYMAISGMTNFGLTGLNVMSLGMIASFLTLTRNFVWPLGQISSQFNYVAMAFAGAERIFAFMDEHPETDEGYVTLVNAHISEDGQVQECAENTGHWAWKHPHRADGSVTYTELKGQITMDDVDFGYVPEKTVLHDITLYAEPGQKIAFVGATGAGKTTITNLINRFYDIADGKIRYDGININKIKKADLRRSLGVVLQDVNLFTDTVMENIRYGNPNATDEECIAAAKLANADGFIRMLEHGYDTVLKGGGSGLSQGQRQLLSIARAAVSDPPVMILDEATSSIDTRTEALVQDGMDKLMQGRTVFVIAHRLSTVQNSDVIMVLDQGRIIERGNHEKLIAQKGVYYQLYTGAFELE